MPTPPTKANKHPDRAGDKVDLGTMIKRRRSSVSEYLRQKGVDTKKKLKSLLDSLENEFMFSSTFLRECDNFINSLMPKKEPEEIIDDSDNKNNASNAPPAEKRVEVSSNSNKLPSKKRKNKSV